MTVLGARGDFEIWQGDGHEIEITVTDDAGEPYNLATVLALTWSLAETWGGTALVSKAIGTGITITDAAAGKLAIEILSADTAGLTGKDYVHQTKMTDAIGQTYTISYGKAVVQKSLV